MAGIDGAGVTTMGEIIQPQTGLAIAPHQIPDICCGQIADGGVAVALQRLAEYRTDPRKDGDRARREHGRCL